MLSKLIKYSKDSLYRNSFFLTLTNIIGSFLGFVYWMLASHYYPVEDVGIATALVSAMCLIALFSRFGLDIGIIRFLPSYDNKNKKELINTCLTLAFILSFIISLAFVLNVNLLAPNLTFIKTDNMIFILFLLSTSITTLLFILRSMFIASRKSEFAFIQNLTWMSLKIILVIFFTSIGALGIYISWSISIFIAITLSLTILTPKTVNFIPKPKIRKEIIKEIIVFSSGNYIALIFRQLPQFVLPIIILNFLGPKIVAYFYIAWMIANLLYSIPDSVGFSLLTEGSYNTNKLKHELAKSLKFLGVMLVPATIFLLLFCKWILYLFGKEYSENAVELLRILAISSIPFALNTLYINIERVKKRVIRVIFIYGFIAICTIGVGSVLMLKIGIIGIGIGFFSANLIILIILLITRQFKDLF